MKFFLFVNIIPIFLESFPEILITASADSPYGVESANIVSLKIWFFIINYLSLQL